MYTITKMKAPSATTFFKAQVLEVPPATCVIVCLIPPLKTFFKVLFWNFVAYDVLGTYSDGCYDDYAYGCNVEADDDDDDKMSNLLHRANLLNQILP